MRREAALAAAVVAVLAAAALVVALVPGAIAQPPPDRESPGRVGVATVDVAAGPVSGQTAVLRLDARLTHRGGSSENVTVEFRAVDAASGLVATSRRVDVPALSGDREVSVTTNLSVERQGGYRIETFVYRDGERVSAGVREIDGLGGLQPDYARTPVGFHRFEGGAADLPVVEYGVAEGDENRTTLSVSAYLTNAGDAETAGADASDLRVVFTARQADSGIVADRATVEVGSIRPGRTVTPSADLAVPSGYNYYLDAVLWSDGVIVDTARSAANLNPSESLSVNVTRDEDGLQVSDFETDESPTGQPQQTPAEDAMTTESAGQPGFGVGVAILALLGAALLARRWTA